ncbi:MAG TPA: peptide deformylase [Spirochaetota bacterium]|nr:peptide deformylase [Spirochaetota bacterium]HOL56058.1 peptide deformylase [Spirochaetota bacterium]HPP03204.1 peptide deformylase [Spirochaetota bacterium]
MILEVIKYGNPLLREESKPIEEINEEVINLVNNMFETMYLNHGIGLAAIQVGIPKRLFVTDIPDIPNSKLVMINPKIIEFSKEKIIYEEGCLSVPDIEDEVERSKSIIVEFKDLNGKVKLIKATGLLSVCIQHEYDHLDGILFIDKALNLNKEGGKKVKI